MRRRIAYALQVQAYGGLKPETKRRLRELHKAFTADPGYTPLPNDGLKPGTMLTREWKGVTYRVGVMDEGFEHKGQRYKSLSEIAGLITGTKWSGPVFFDIRDPLLGSHSSLRQTCARDRDRRRRRPSPLQPTRGFGMPLTPAAE
jgi:hypothetical protein